MLNEWPCHLFTCDKGPEFGSGFDALGPEFAQWKHYALTTSASCTEQLDNWYMLRKRIKLLRWWLFNFTIKCIEYVAVEMDGHFPDFVGEKKSNS